MDALLAAALRLIDPGETATLIETHTARHAALYGLARLEEADAEYVMIERLAATALERADATTVQVHSLTHRQRIPEALELGADSLRALGIDLPADRSSADIDAQFEHLYRWLETADDLDTVERTVLSTLIAAGVAIPLGIFLGASERLYRSVEFVVDFFRSTPASAMFPLFLVLFGVGNETKIAVAAFGAALVILFNVAYGVMNARKTRLLAAKVMGASRLQVLTGVVLLESMPQTFIGLRNGVSLALVIVVVAEMFIGSTDGLGHRVFEAQQLFNMPEMYAAIFAAGALGYGLNLLFLVVERYFVHWSGK